MKKYGLYISKGQWNHTLWGYFLYQTKEKGHHPLPIFYKLTPHFIGLQCLGPNHLWIVMSHGYISLRDQNQ